MHAWIYTGIYQLDFEMHSLKLYFELEKLFRQGEHPYVTGDQVSERELTGPKSPKGILRSSGSLRVSSRGRSTRTLQL